MKNKLYLLLISILIFTSCDILRFSRFEVLSWTPGDGIFPEPEHITISLSFSHEPNMASVERNFSLTGDGNRIRGAFYWENRKVTFIPLAPLELNTDYTLNLSADASNTRGLNMDESFNRNFTTRPGNVRPVLLSYYPAMYSEISDPRAKIKLEFSIPVPLLTLYDNVSFIPSMTGFWTLENDGKLAVFTPAEPWMLNNRYEIRFSTSLTDNNKMNIGNDFTSFFTTQTDYELPSLVHAYRITKDGEYLLMFPDKGFISAAELPVENQNWEKEDRLSLVFSKPVDSITVKNYTSIEDGPNLVMETSGGFKTEYTFRLENIPAFESRFTLRIKPGIKDSSGNESKDEYFYRVFANGMLSKPPMLAGLRMPMAPESVTDLELEYFGIDSLFRIISISDENYPSGENIITWIELYFITAQGASIDIFSVMEHFRTETSNNVITFSPRRIKTSGFTVSEPQPGWENYERIEISGNLVNTTNFGIINFQIAPGLRDSFGNLNDKQQKISLIK